jgi:hypothetical protein
MYCVIKYVKNKRVLKGNSASFVFNIYNAKTQICVTGPQCVKYSVLNTRESHTAVCDSFTASLKRQYAIFTHIQENCSQLNTQKKASGGECSLPKYL